jgi:L-fuconolactonase
MTNSPIVDTHVHFWDIHHLRYPWLGDVPSLNRTFLPADYDSACHPVAVDKMVFVQCECDPAQYLDEVAWVSELAGHDPRIQGMVPWAPLEKGLAVLPELERLAKNPLIRGIRRIIQFESDPGFCLRPDFIAGVKLLPRFGWTFDICISHVQLANTIRFVEQCPDVRFVLDHIGKPDIKGGKFEPWAGELGELAKFRNVHCKVSSLATEADHANWTLDDLRPYVDRVFECFGFERTMFAGDWPVSGQAATYPRCVETLQQLTAGASETDLRRLFRDNALAFCSLPQER